MKQEDQREDDREELTHQGRWARRLPRGSDSRGRRAPTHKESAGRAFQGADG